MRFSDGFIFTNNCDLIEEKGNINIIKSIMNGIKISKRSFSYNSCLFLLNKSDKKIDLDINESKEKLENIFFENKLNENNIINLNVNKFSCQLYDKYLKFLDKYIWKIPIIRKTFITKNINFNKKQQKNNNICYINNIKC